ncbi:MAG: CotH kinase family protein [Candidatus Rokuibacteriota bacterium]
MSRRTGLLLAGLGACVLALAGSDSLLLALPESVANGLERRLARGYERAGVLAAWTFDDHEVAEAVSGARSPSFGTVLAPARYGAGRRFDGHDETYISTTVPWSALETRYTISTWVQVAPSVPDQALIYTEGRGVTSGLRLAGGWMTLAVPHADGQFVSYRFESYGRFVNVTAVVDLAAGAAALYEDGVLRGSMPIRGVSHAGGTIEFGKARPHHVYYPLNGVLDETVIWRRPLSAAEVREVARARRPLARRLGSRDLLARRATAAVIGAVDAVLKAVDRLNPTLHAAHLQHADLPVISLVLSRDDLRALAARRQRWVRTGAASTRAGRGTRRVGLVRDGTVHPAEIVPYGDEPALWRNPKPSFTLRADGLATGLGARSVLLVPPESAGLLRPLLYRRLAAKHGTPGSPTGLALLRINGRQLGLYYFQGDPEGSPRPSPTDGFAPLADIPSTGGAILEEYDALRASVEPLLLNDKSISWHTRAIRRRIHADREALSRWVARERPVGADAEVARVAAYLTEERVLNGNPAASYVIDDLDLRGPRLPGRRITWTSSDPDVIGPDGAVTRPAGRTPVRVRVEAAIARDQTVARRTLEFTVMPEALDIPALRLRIPGQLRNTHRTPCLVEFIEDGGARRTGWLAGAVKLRGNTTLLAAKKSLSLRLDAPYRVPGFSASPIVHLLGAQVDASLMRNKLAYDLFRSFAEPGSPRFSPQVRFVELFVNDRYTGIYQLSERVDRFLLDFAPGPGDAPGVVYKTQHRDATFRRLVRYAYTQIEPDADDGPYWQPLEDLVAFVGQSSPETFGRDIGRRLDIPTYIDFTILVNLFANREGLRFNFYVARDPAAESRFVVIPWDYDKTLFDPRPEWMVDFLLHRMRADLPGFTDRLRQRWRDLRRRQLTEAALLGRIDELDRLLAGSVPRELERWPTRHDPRERVVRDMKAWLARRLTELDATIAGL